MNFVDKICEFRECGKIENEPSDKMNAESGAKCEIASGEKGK